MINYPNKKVVSSPVQEEIVQKKKIVYNAANRGMELEHAVNLSNKWYDEKGRAIITKRPTPIHIVKVDYQNMRIKDAYFEKQSTTDYNGVYRGKYIDFECKETISRTSFSLNNISSHQIEHLKKVLFHGGIAFFMIYFKSYNEIYLVDSSFIISKFEDKTKKSISYAVLKENGHLIKQGFNPHLLYLDVVDEVYFNENK